MGPITVEPGSDFEIMGRVVKLFREDI